MKDERLTVFLSPGELFCIAGSLGFANLPLVGSHYRGHSPDQIKEDINRGREVLESRGLIKRYGPRNWEVDASLTGLVEFIARPEYCLVLSAWRKNETHQQVFLYIKGRQGLSVTFQNRYFNLAVYRETKLMSKYVVGWLGIAQQPSLNLPEFTLPLVDLRVLFEKIWDKPENASEILQETGLTTAQVNTIADLLGQTSAASNLTLLVPEGERFNRQGQLFFVNNPMNLWYNESIQAPTDSLKFQPIQAGRAQIRVDRYLRGKAGEEEPSSDEEREYL